MDEGGSVCVYVRERESGTGLSGERYSHKLGGSQSCQPKSLCGCGKKKKERHREDGGSQFSEEKERRYLLLLFLLSEWLEGEPGWCDLLHHGMQPLYPAEA